MQPPITIPINRKINYNCISIWIFISFVSIFFKT
nr:MAG TPA: hypothetical protein [Caudoviricetes sp.]